jgi:long-chain acyl-CoA synthetase
MRVNRLVDSRDRHSVREMVEGFDPAWLPLPALQMKRPDGYWRLTYRDLQNHVRGFGEALLARGVRKGDRVGLIAENRSEWVLTYLAVTCIGAIIVPYDILLKVDELAVIVRASGARTVVTSSEYLEKVTRTLGAMKDSPVEALILCDDTTAPVPGVKVLSFHEMLAQGMKARAEGGRAYDNAVVAPLDPAALIFTSGTTGTPKGVLLSNRGVVENGDAVQMTTKLGFGDNWIIVLPFHHTYPTNMGIFVPLLSGAVITPVPSMKTNVLIGIMKETTATCIPAMPLLIEKIYKGVWTSVKARGPLIHGLFRSMFAVSRFFFTVLHVRIGKYLFKSVARELGLTKIRWFVSGGGPITKDTIDGMESLGFPTYQGYGLTETSPVVSTSCPSNNRPGSVGVQLWNVEVRIDVPDQNGNGEILVRGSCVMLGYYNMEDKTREVIDAEGWFHTGDIGKLDKDGFLYVTGRLKNIIVTKGGKNIYPEEIEALLSANPLLSEVVVVGRLDKEGGEYPHAIIYPDPELLSAMEKEQGKTFTDDEVRALVRAEIQKCMAGVAVYKIPHDFDVSREELPKSGTRKVKRFLFAEARR